jgi:hypothetical protein
MNPDNPNFRTPEEECRAEELVKARETIARQAREIKFWRRKLVAYVEGKPMALAAKEMQAYYKELAAIERAEGEKEHE